MPLEATGVGLQHPPVAPTSPPDSPVTQPFLDEHSRSKNWQVYQFCKTVLSIIYYKKQSLKCDLYKRCFGNFKKNYSKKPVIELVFLLSSSFLVSNFTKTELLYKSFQGFFLGYQFILLPVHVFMAHSWKRVPNSFYIMKSPLYSLPHLLKILSNPSFLSPPTFTSTDIFDLAELVIMPHFMCYFI